MSDTFRKNALGAYKSIVKAMVRSDRRSRIAQRLEERRKEIAMLTYKRMNVVREQNQKDLDTMQKAKLFKDLQVLNRKVNDLKEENIECDKRLLFIKDTSMIRKCLVDNDVNGDGDAAKLIQHIKDIGSFLSNQREYDELIERYNCSSKLSQEEIIRRTAGKVGLDVPS